MRLGWLAISSALVASSMGWSACHDGRRSAPPAAPTESKVVDYMGRAACAGCHPEEARLWEGSHHDLAMQEASPETVRGDFADAMLEHRGERFRFHRRNGRFFVEAAGADAVVRDFEVTHTFGVEPLQQYLVPLPGGRLQALGVAWDTRPAAKGGQRWLHLHPGEAVPPDDVLHWTGPAGSWNAMCADCHSTNLSKGYRAEDDAYDSTWSEIDVSCEACHGPGSRHVAWAERGADPDVRDRGLVVDLGAERAWRFAETSPIAQRLPLQGPGNEIEACAPCHARRARIALEAPGSRFLDGYRPALLEEGLYHADGQILDEVYVWGSFVQSRMYAAGVVCSDCHDPHRLRIDEPDAACAGCHQSETFAAPSHHHHAADSPGASCVACHMPERTYMVVDTRRDHSFRVPRPDLSGPIGTPNVCSGCHADRPVSWVAQVAARWYGSERAQTRHYGEVLEAGRRRAPGASSALATLSKDTAQPAIVRATAIALLGGQLTAGSLPALGAGLRDPDPLVRVAAAGAAEGLPPRDRWLALGPLLRDDLRAVRIEAARVLAPLRRQVSDPGANIALDEALAEYREAQSLSADRPEGRVNLGLLHTELGELDAAEREYETALRLSAWFLPAYLNLADLHRMRGRDDTGKRVLRQALERFPDSAEVHHALGLLLVRSQRADEALDALERAAKLAPESPRHAYVYGVALASAGKPQRALAVLEEAHRSHPGTPDLLVALATLHRDAGDLDAALVHARKLVELRPEDPAARSLVLELESRGP